MLSHRPWICSDPSDKPPPCDTVLLQEFKAMVIYFLSHAEWRQATYGEHEPPKPKEWLPRYWDRYLHGRTKNDYGPSYGPLWPYLDFEEQAKKCLGKSADMRPPHQNVKCWQEWEEMLRQQSVRIFWDPSELFRS